MVDVWVVSHEKFATFIKLLSGTLKETLSAVTRPWPAEPCNFLECFHFLSTHPNCRIISKYSWNKLMLFHGINL